MYAHGPQGGDELARRLALPDDEISQAYQTGTLNQMFVFERTFSVASERFKRGGCSAMALVIRGDGWAVADMKRYLDFVRAQHFNLDQLRALRDAWDARPPPISDAGAAYLHRFFKRCC